MCSVESAAAESAGKVRCMVCLLDFEAVTLFAWQERLEKRGGGGSQTGVGGGLNEDAEMGCGDSRFRETWLPTEKERVLAGACAVQGGLIYKMRNDVEMQMKRRWEDGRGINRNFHR